MNTYIFLLALLINHSPNAVVDRGLPVYFSVRITSSAIEPGEEENVRKCIRFQSRKQNDSILIKPDGIIEKGFSIHGTDSWSDKLSFQLFDDTEKRWKVIRWNLSMVRTEPDVPVFISDEESILTADFVLSPEDAAEIPEGQYSLRAVARLTDGEGKPIEVVTHPVNLQLSGRLADLGDPAVLFTLAEYHANTGDTEKALEYARRYSLIHSKPIENHVLMGDVYFTANRFEEALKQYQMAMAQTDGATPHSYLELIEEKIDQVYAKMPSLLEMQLKISDK